jgi:sulfatase maturation enzyme AslB (radical SAM superfamily)
LWQPGPTIGAREECAAYAIVEKIGQAQQDRARAEATRKDRKDCEEKRLCEEGCRLQEHARPYANRRQEAGGAR